MQYILTEDEMADIRREREDRRQMPSLQALVNVVQHVACNMVDLSPANGREPQTKPHGCIHVKDNPPSQARLFGYCDHCSVQDICPQPKEWSK